MIHLTFHPHGVDKISIPTVEDQIAKAAPAQWDTSKHHDKNDVTTLCNSFVEWLHSRHGNEDNLIFGHQRHF